jgi:predicted dehydrogenase
MSAPARLSRRRVLAAAGASVAAPLLLPARVFGAGDRLVFGAIGLNGQGLAVMGGVKDQVAAVCDVDKNNLARAVDRCGGKAEGFGDYRKLLERKDLDAVIVATPDHWHALITIDACKAGKDVYCEKPLTLTVVEGRKVVETARAQKRIVQTGSQQRSGKDFRLACELVRNGRLGKLQKVLVGLPGVNFKGPAVPDSEPPAYLDYDFWLGPAPKRPYNEKRVHYNFRFFWDYSGGQMTNFGAHDIDIAQWGLGMDESGPVSCEGSGTFHPEKWFEVPQSCRVTHTYASGVQVIVGQGQKDIPGNVTFIGSDGEIHVNRGKIASKPEDIIKQPLKDGDVRLAESKGHMPNFIECVKTRNLPVADAEIGHRSATVCHLGNIAIRLGRKIAWDPKAETIPDDKEAAAMLTRFYRAPWTL